jgi:hypothetical protein
MEGWRMATVAVRSMWRNACPSPTVVVVFPSPSGVGVIAVTTTYVASGRSGEGVGGLQLDLGDVLAVGLQIAGVDAHVAGDAGRRLERGAV